MASPHPNHKDQDNGNGKTYPIASQPTCMVQQRICRGTKCQYPILLTLCAFMCTTVRQHPSVERGQASAGYKTDREPPGASCADPQSKQTTTQQAKQKPREIRLGVGHSVLGAWPDGTGTRAPDRDLPPRSPLSLPLPRSRHPGYAARLYLRGSTVPRRIDINRRASMPRIYIGRHWFNPETAHKWTDWPHKERLYMAIDQSDPESALDMPGLSTATAATACTISFPWPRRVRGWPRRGSWKSSDRPRFCRRWACAHCAAPGFRWRPVRRNANAGWRQPTRPAPKA